MAPKKLPWVTTEYCEQCTVCVSACPRGLKMRAVDDGHEVPWLDNPDDCTGCGRCADACGLGAISMTEYVEEARARFLDVLPSQ